MANQATTEVSLFPGLRFHPTDVELVCYYLKRKIYGLPFRSVIGVLDLYESEPWDLPPQSKLKSRDLEWYFFSTLDMKYTGGQRTNRATEKGYWKATGKDRSIKRKIVGMKKSQGTGNDRPIQCQNTETVGMKKSLVFYIGRPPHGRRTDWVMHEYRIVDKELKGLMLQSYVLCKVFKKSGLGPKKGEEHMVSLVEDDREDTVVPGKGKEVKIDDEFFNVEEKIQESNFEQNPDMGMPFKTASIPSSSSCMDGCNLGFVEENQNLHFGSYKIDDLLELPDEQYFLDLPQQHQTNSAPLIEEGFYAPLMDFAENLGVDYSNDHSLDAFVNPLVDNIHILEHINLSNPVEAVPSWFEKVDDCLLSFDAIDCNSQFADVDLDNIMRQSDFTPEELKLLASSQLLEIDGGEGASSSKQIPVSTELVQDAKYNEGCDSTTNSWISRMLGSIDAPPAFASEFPLKEAFFDQSLAIHSNSICVKAEMTRISGWQKVGSVLMRCAFGFLFIWILIVSLIIAKH